jgi:hypothetical protein
MSPNSTISCTAADCSDPAPTARSAARAAANDFFTFR